MQPFEKQNNKPNPFQEGKAQFMDNLPPNTSGVIFVDPVEQTQKQSAPRCDEKMYWIKMKKDHTTRIGGIVYDLKAGQKVKVTKEVRDIFAKSPLGLLDPIID